MMNNKKVLGITLLLLIHQHTLLMAEDSRCYSPDNDEIVLYADSLEENDEAINTALANLSHTDVLYNIKNCLDTVPFKEKTVAYFRNLFDQAITLYSFDQLTLNDLKTFVNTVDDRIKTNAQENFFALPEDNEEAFVSYMHQAVYELEHPMAFKSPDASPINPSSPTERRIRRREFFPVVNAGTQAYSGNVSGALSARELAIARSDYINPVTYSLDSKKVQAALKNFIRQPYSPLSSYTPARIRVLFDILIQYGTPTPKYKPTLEKVSQYFELAQQFVQAFQSRLALEFQDRPLTHAWQQLSHYLENGVRKQRALIDTLQVKYEEANKILRPQVRR